MNLLSVIDRRVRKHTKAATLAGRVCIGIKHRDRPPRWWLATLDRRVQTEWPADLPDFDVALGLDEDAASDILRGQVPRPGSLCIKKGDSDLLERFLCHYFGDEDQLSWLELRAGAG